MSSERSRHTPEEPVNLRKIAPLHSSRSSTEPQLGRKDVRGAEDLANPSAILKPEKSGIAPIERNSERRRAKRNGE